MYPAELVITLEPTGRHLAFRKEPLEKANVYRRVFGRGSAWELIALNAPSPFLDAEPFQPGTTLEYHVQHLTQQDSYLGHSLILRLTLSGLPGFAPR